MSALSRVEPWDLVADGYAAITAALFEGFSETALELVPVKAGDAVIDIACGPGTLSLLAAESRAEVTAVDFSAAMLAHLKSKAHVRALTGLRGIEADGQALPLEDEAFDAAFSMFGLMFFSDRAAGFSEMYRTLKPGGRACVSSWAAVTASPLISLMLGAFQRVNPNLPDPEYDIESLENPDKLRGEMEQAGFRNVVVHTIEDKALFRSAQDLWTSFAKGSAPISMARSQMQDEVWQRRSAQAVAFIKERVDTFPVELGSTAHLAVGSKPD